MKTEILSTHTPALFAAAVQHAAELLRAGEVVALPTETVYGLAANALDEKAVAKIYEVKGRPAHNPIIVHVSDAAMARRCVADWPATADKLSKSFWPGPLTLVLARGRRSEIRDQRSEISSQTDLRPLTSDFWIPDIVTAGGDTVGVRWPSHPFIQAVIRECDFPLAAPSANPSNQISPTTAAHVAKNLGGKIPLVVDGGQSQVGIESAVIDLTANPPRVLRPGMIHEESLLAALADCGLRIADCGLETGGALRSPGLLEKHYSPKAKLVMLNWQSDADLRFQLSTFNFQLSTTQIIAHTRIPASFGADRVSVIPHDAAAFARAIYAELHRCDEAGAELIVVESPPETPEWRGVADRLRRAAA